MNLGQKVRDQITGFSGIVTGVVEYITGCRQALVQPPCNPHDGTFVDSRWFDEDRLIIVDPKPLALVVSTSGPDKRAPSK